MSVKAPGSYIHGLDGPVVIVTARVASVLYRLAPLDDLRVQLRGRDAETSQILLELHIAALRHRESVAGGALEPAVAAVSRPEPWLTVKQAAQRLHLSERGVRDACERGRLKASKTAGGHWRMTRIDVEHYRSAE